MLAWLAQPLIRLKRCRSHHCPTRHRPQRWRGAMVRSGPGSTRGPYGHGNLSAPAVTILLPCVLPSLLSSLCPNNARAASHWPRRIEPAYSTQRTRTKLVSGTVAPVQVFGRRRHRGSPHARRAGVQKAPGREVAGSWAAAGRRALWGFQVSGAFDGGGTVGRCDLHACMLHLAAAERAKEASRAGFEGRQRAPGALIAMNRVERDRRRRGAGATEREGGGADRRSGS